jgi:hypothetical protein
MAEFNFRCECGWGVDNASKREVKFKIKLHKKKCFLISSDVINIWLENDLKNDDFIGGVRVSKHGNVIPGRRENGINKDGIRIEDLNYLLKK